MSSEEHRTRGIKSHTCDFLSVSAFPALLLFRCVVATLEFGGALRVTTEVWMKWFQFGRGFEALGVWFFFSGPDAFEVGWVCTLV